MLDMAVRPEIRLAAENDLRFTRMSCTEIANRHGVAVSTVRKWSALLRRVRLAEQAKEQASEEKGE